MNAIHKPKIVLVSKITMLLIHITLCHLFIVILKLNVVSVMISYDIATFGNFLFLALYCRFYLEQKIPILGFLDVSLLRWESTKNYLKLGAPSMLMNAVEVWSFELIRLMSALLGTVALATMSICFNYVFIFYSVADGF